MSAQINISGFFDLQHSYTLSNSLEHKVEFGQFEIGLDKKISEKLNIQGAIAFNSETGNFELGSGFADFNLVSENISNNLLPSKFGIMVGQYDVPFGIDYKCIASPDRDMVSQPLAIQNSIGCLNSLGIEFHGESDYYNFNVSVINNYADNIAYSSRVGIRPLTDLEIGISRIATINSSQNFAPHANGFDLKYDFNNSQLKSVFILANDLFRDEKNQIISEQMNYGYYLQGMYNFIGPFNIQMATGFRFGKWESLNSILSEQINNNQYRMTGLLGMEIMQNAKLKFEFSSNKFEQKSTNQIIYTQLVLSF